MALTRTLVQSKRPGTGRWVQIADTAANDSDKALAVPADKMWQVLWLYASFVTTATVGNRQVDVEIRDDSANVLWTAAAAAVQAASLTHTYRYDPDWDAAPTNSGTEHYVPLPGNLWLPPLYDIRIYDSAAVDAAADDLTIRGAVLEYEA